MRWKLFWTAGISLLLSLLFWKNHRRFRYKSLLWKLGKSFIEGGLLVLSAIYVPVLLIVYGSMWATGWIKKDKLRLGASILVGIALTLLADVVLELLLVLGIFSIDLVSDDFLAFFRERREKRYGQGSGHTA